MATIYAPPEEIKVPEINWRNFNKKEHDENIEKFKQELRTYLKDECGYNHELTGEVVQFPVADGYAEYMVASIRPLELIHLPIDDAYNYPYIERLKAKDIKDKLHQQKKLAELFGKKKEVA